MIWHGMVHTKLEDRRQCCPLWRSLRGSRRGWSETWPVCGGRRWMVARRDGRTGRRLRGRRRGCSIVVGGRRRFRFLQHGQRCVVRSEETHDDDGRIRRAQVERPL